MKSLAIFSCRTLLRRNQYAIPIYKSLNLCQQYQFVKVGKKKQEIQEKKKEKLTSNLSDTVDITKIESKFKDFLVIYKDHLIKIKVGRLTPDILDPLIVNCYGEKQSMRTMAQISSKAANILQLNVFDEGALGEIQKTLENSSLNLQIKRDGKIITCTQIGGNTKEQKLEVVKTLKQYVEQSKLGIRRLRGEGMEYVKTFKKAISEDVIKNAEKEVEALNNKFISELEELAKQKEKELMNC